ncbi:substrate-binding domain-containing protein [Halovulum sp. GXIMD14793]
MRTLFPCLLALSICFGHTAAAQQVRLDSINGTASISGELLEYDGVNFKVQTPVGVFSVNAATVVCSGAGCPNLDALPSVFAISAPPGLAALLVPDIITTYGEDQDADVFQDLAGDNSSAFRIVSSDGQEQADITLNARSSTEAIADLLSGQSAIAVSDRAVTDQEQAAFEQSGKGSFGASNEQMLALDGLVVVVAPENPVRTIDPQSLAKVFSGEVVNWSQLGGASAPIEILVPGQGSSAMDALQTSVLAPNGKSLGAQLQVVEDGFVSDLVLNNPNAIGIGTFSTLRNARALSIAGLCGLPIEASVFTIKSGEYPLVQPVHLYFARQSLPLHARQMLDYAKNDFVQSIVLDSGLVDRSVSTRSIDSHGQHLISAITDVRDTDTLVAVQRLFGNLSEAERLSTMFWFPPSDTRPSDTLSEQAQALAAYFNTIDMTNKEIQVLGFSDRLEDTTESADLSRQRAETVRDLLVQAGGNAPWLGNVRTFGYASIAPLGCNDDESGRALNRRVEVWLRNAR